MKKSYFILLLFPSILFAGQPRELSNQTFSATISKIPASVVKKVKKYSWHPGCPVPIKDLRYIQLTYWGYDHQPHTGVLIINKALANDVVSIFKSLFDHHFLIERMELISEYKGDDEASMEANNTSAFNCRDTTDSPGTFSQHSYGRAIDINPKINPFVDGKIILPKNGKLFVDRNMSYLGKITKNSYIYRVFKQKGWDWGGNWYSVQDYQHFEKRANGEKRNPYG